MRELAFDRGRQAGDDHEAGSPGFEPLDELVVVKPFVRADDHQPHPGGGLGEARPEQVERPAGRMGIARPQLSMPEVLGSALEAEQRVIRRPASLDRVVPDPGLLLLAVDDEDRRVDVEDQARWRVWARRHPREEAVVQQAQLGERRRCHAEQEAPQRGGIRVGAQPGQILEHAVLTQQLGGLDAFQAQDHRVEQRQQRLAEAVAVVALLHADRLAKGSLQSNPAQESMDEVRAAVVRQRVGAEVDDQRSWSLGHCVQPYPRGSFRRNRGLASFSRIQAA